ncbi:MAG: hypothetical protein S4CHLAM102_02760 [Chlamydiia bacterium]|nr:hypothetical protein [Chlamydiia bacterium]
MAHDAQLILAGTGLYANSNVDFEGRRNRDLLVSLGMQIDQLIQPGALNPFNILGWHPESGAFIGGVRIWCALMLGFNQHVDQFAFSVFRGAVEMIGLGIVFLPLDVFRSVDICHTSCN